MVLHFIYYLQPFEAAGALVRMVLQIIVGMKYFLVVLAIALVGEANAFYMPVRVESEVCFDGDGMGTDTEGSIAFADPTAAAL